MMDLTRDLSGLGVQDLAGEAGDVVGGQTSSGWDKFGIVILTYLVNNAGAVVEGFKQGFAEGSSGW